MNMINKSVGIFSLIYLLTRGLSFLFPPESIANNVIGISVLLSLIYLLIYKKDFFWFLVAGEIILGGSGNLFQIGGISLRTCILGISLVYYLFTNFKQFFQNKLNQLILLSIITISIFASLRGLYLGHDLKLVIPDFIPYLFLFYFFPLQKLWTNEKWKKFCLNLVLSAVIGNAIFIAFTFFSYSTNFFVLQDNYYHWFRDVATGKITLINFNFYRLVLNDHLLLVPLLIYFLYEFIYKKNSTSLIYISLLLYILSINLTRIYILAVFIGITALFKTQIWKRWLAAVSLVLTIFLFSLSASFYYASDGQSFGLETIGLRIQSIASPQIENSSLSRLLLLPKIVEMIIINPLFGTGFGEVISVYSPVFKDYITTPHFDWGYLEMITEVGIFGFLVWLVFLLYIFLKIKKSPTWQLSSFLTLLTINLTSPALFHVLGIIWLIILYSLQDDVSLL